MQPEIDLAERASADSYHLGFIAQQCCAQDVGDSVTGFHGIVSVHVGGYADGRTIEIYGNKRDSLSARRIRHPAFYLGGLCCHRQRKQERQKDCKNHIYVNSSSHNKGHT